MGPRTVICTLACSLLIALWVADPMVAEEATVSPEVKAYNQRLAGVCEQVIYCHKQYIEYLADVDPEATKRKFSKLLDEMDTFQKEYTRRRETSLLDEIRNRGQALKDICYQLEAHCTRPDSFKESLSQSLQRYQALREQGKPFEILESNRILVAQADRIAADPTASAIGEPEQTRLATKETHLNLIPPVELGDDRAVINLLIEIKSKQDYLRQLNPWLADTKTQYNTAAAGVKRLKDQWQRLQQQKLQTTRDERGARESSRIEAEILRTENIDTDVSTWESELGEALRRHDHDVERLQQELAQKNTELSSIKKLKQRAATLCALAAQGDKSPGLEEPELLSERENSARAASRKIMEQREKEIAKLRGEIAWLQQEYVRMERVQVECRARWFAARNKWGDSLVKEYTEERNLSVAESDARNKANQQLGKEISATESSLRLAISLLVRNKSMYLERQVKLTQLIAERDVLWALYPWIRQGMKSLNSTVTPLQLDSYPWKDTFLDVAKKTGTPASPPAAGNQKPSTSDPVTDSGKPLEARKEGGTKTIVLLNEERISVQNIRPIGDSYSLTLRPGVFRIVAKSDVREILEGE